MKDYRASQLILAAFCYVTAAMIWEIGNKMVYIGETQMWFVVLITSLFACAGLAHQFDGVFINAD